MKKTIVVSSATMGEGSEELGQKLMGSFLRKVWAGQEKPGAILFYNSGVELVTEGSPVTDALNGLLQAGVDLMACGTCIRYYGLENKVVVGRVSNMQEIASTLMSSESVVSL